MAKQRYCIPPAERFLILLKDKHTRNQIKSNKEKKEKRVVVFYDGGKLIFCYKSQRLVRMFPDGTKQQFNPDGTCVLVCPKRARTHAVYDFDFILCLTM